MLYVLKLYSEETLFISFSIEEFFISIKLIFNIFFNTYKEYSIPFGKNDIIPLLV